MLEATLPASAEQLLIAKAAGGDLNAFNQLVLTYQNLTYSVAYRTLQEEEAAADAVQESMIKAFRSLSSFQGGSFKSWIIRIVVNTCYALRNRKRRRTESLDDLGGDDDYGADGASDWPAVGRSCRAARRLRQRMELSQLIEHGINACRDQRLALTLCDVHGYAYGDQRSPACRWARQIAHQPRPYQVMSTCCSTGTVPAIPSLSCGLTADRWRQCQLCSEPEINDDYCALSQVTNELLSAYIDQAVSEEERRRSIRPWSKTRCGLAPGVAAGDILLLHELPALSLLRSFVLTPEQVGQATAAPAAIAVPGVSVGQRWGTPEMTGAVQERRPARGRRMVGQRFGTISGVAGDASAGGSRLRNAMTANAVLLTW
jgi:RNA polymerase sigma-70 factor (ECF subfamily)